MSPTTSGAADPADKSGFLELRGFKHKLFVAVAGDKVFLYKNAEVGGWRGGLWHHRGPRCHFEGDPFPSHPQPEQSGSELGHPGAATPKRGPLRPCRLVTPRLQSPSPPAPSLGVPHDHRTHCSCSRACGSPCTPGAGSWAGKGHGDPQPPAPVRCAGGSASTSSCRQCIIRNPPTAFHQPPPPPSPTRTIGWGSASPTSR